MVKQTPESRNIAVQFDSVSFSYGDVPVLENASFHIHQGEFAALVGPNGSGKTTVIKLILGLEQPSAGQITLFKTSKVVNDVNNNVNDINKKINGEQSAIRHNKIGYVPQLPPADRAFPIAVRDVVRMGLLHPSQGYGLKGGARAAADRAMEQAGIAELADRSWKALSGGQRRRALVARALVSQPELLVLDEPTANMDTESEGRLFETLEKLKNATTILIVTHDMNFVSSLTGKVLCLGDDNHRRGVVQHRTEVDAGDAHKVRVLHQENVPDDECCDEH